MSQCVPSSLVHIAIGIARISITKRDGASMKGTYFIFCDLMCYLFTANLTTMSAATASKGKTICEH
jgi:hypothetical protein